METTEKEAVRLRNLRNLLAKEAKAKNKSFKLDKALKDAGIETNKEIEAGKKEIVGTSEIIDDLNM